LQQKWDAPNSFDEPYQIRIFGRIAALEAEKSFIDKLMKPNACLLLFITDKLQNTQFYLFGSIRYLG
jgi:hypothetical protein